MATNNTLTKIVSVETAANAMKKCLTLYAPTSITECSKSITSAFRLCLAEGMIPSIARREALILHEEAKKLNDTLKGLVAECLWWKGSRARSATGLQDDHADSCYIVAEAKPVARIVGSRYGRWVGYEIHDVKFAILASHRTAPELVFWSHEVPGSGELRFRPGTGPIDHRQIYHDVWDRAPEMA